MQSFHNLEWLDGLYNLYLTAPDQLEPSWRYFFQGWELGQRQSSVAAASEDHLEVRAYHLLQAYRKYGHLLASFNPISVQPSILLPELELHTLGFAEGDLGKEVPTHGFLPEQKTTLANLIDALKKTYCRKIGIEYMGLGVPELEQWLQSKIEPYFEPKFSSQAQKTILNGLNRAELFEGFMHTKYAGQKRFSIEGGETLIPMMMEILEQGASLGVSDVVIGMAHRGRLNVLANILGKSYAHIFHEFEDHYSPDVTEGTGDVKYHKGFTGEFRTRQGTNISLMMAANPSHLESVDPIVEGGVKALQFLGKKNLSTVLPILIHGDASLAGQGVVYETMQLSRLNGYGTGGTIHIVINNQIGFTTLPKEGRSTRYCTDIAKAFSSPVFHVDAEDPEGCVLASLLAIEVRQKFGCDVFIDLNCYRKYGHNEGDEPFFTQPLEYRLIRSKKTIRELYLAELLSKHALTSAEAAQMEEEFKKDLGEALMAAKVSTKELLPPKPSKAAIQEPSTEVSSEELRQITLELSLTPPGFEPHPKVRRLLQERVLSFDQPKEKPSIDWATAESLAYATLLKQGVHVRISGQDSRRGTFSHRHAALVDQAREGKYFPLSHLKGATALFDVYNSPLSEFAVLGFEFGYSLVADAALVIWEAQYGDFVNGAQIVTDQYIASSEQKWGLASSITLFLPHGYEGQGPEHSSGRIERFLQLSAEGNMRVANVTTPAQLFHLLRRQALIEIKKPLILFTPKAMLRHPLFLSPQLDFEKGQFHTALDDPSRPSKASTLIFCSGKIYYDLFTEREKRGKQEEYALIRLEMLHPFVASSIHPILQRYKDVKKVAWVQEEHANMGAYPFIRPFLEEELRKHGGMRLNYIGRAESAATAAGSYQLHKRQYQSIMEQVFDEHGH